MKRVVTICVLLCAFVWANLAFADSYLDTAALLLDQSRRNLDWAERRAQDKQHVHVAHLVAEAHVKAGQQIQVAKEADRAHPHLLLTLETAERALFAAKEGELKRFLRLRRQAREEERAFRELLQQAKKTLPELRR